MKRELVTIEFEVGGEVEGTLERVFDGGVKVWTTMGSQFFAWQVIKQLYLGSEEIEAWRCMVANLEQFYQRQQQRHTQGQHHDRDRTPAIGGDFRRATA